MGVLHQAASDTERMTTMTRTPSWAETDNLLAALCTLVIARKQARWQWANCADEHQHKWTVVIAKLDTRIERGEAIVGTIMDIPGFRMKREIVK